MNNVNIIGRIGKEIELKYLQSGSAVASFSIAVDQSYKKDGQKVEKTSWFDITGFGKTAEIVNQYFNKGSMIGVSGELEQQTWNDQQGQKKSKVIIKLKDFTFIDKRDSNQAPQQNYQAPQQQQTYQAPPTTYENQRGQPVPPPRQQPQQPQGLDIDDGQIPF